MTSLASVPAMVRQPDNRRQFELAIDGADSIELCKFDILHPMNGPGETECTFRSFDLGLDTRSLLGKAARIRFACGDANDGARRSFHGIVRRVGLVRVDDDCAYFQAIIVPRLWNLSQRVNCKVHVTDRAQKRTIRWVLESVLREAGLGVDDYQISLGGSYEPYTFLTQYRESDLEFISRLCEEEGISFFVDQLADRDMVVFTDSNATYKMAEPFDQVLVRPDGGAIQDEFEEIQRFDHAYEIHPTRTHLRDFDFRNIERKTVGDVAMNGRDDFEYYEFPGKFQDEEDSKKRMARLARIRAEEFESKSDRVRGSGNFRSMAAGRVFETVNHPARPLNRRWLCLSVRHCGDENLDGFGVRKYSNEFECTPDDLNYRPERRTKRPKIVGTQTAMVVGPKGEEIYTDRFGRVKLQMHWDRLGTFDETSSCWVRVAQPHAGKGWGMIDIPRIGEEVMVQFQDGDPDRPIVTGRVYNATNMPPFALPGQMTRTGMKSQTHKGTGFNEISMDDTAGAEQIRMHAQYNMDTVVENNQTLKVGVDRKAEIGNDDSTQVGNNQQTIVGNNILLDAGTSITLRCGASMIHMNQAGFIQITGTVIAVAGAVNCSMTAPVTNITGGVLLTEMGGVVEIAGGLTQVRGATQVDVISSGPLVQKGTPITLN